ncbi:site-specific integrase [Agarivorans aestuarii]|uniref:site-specific integrase n=1 Tax=Agarivorans aestuarii TaxID=1563703 RepID=UPI001C7EDB34|nr:site-specific integrase [Agarivorans aestuarii]
MRNADKSEQFIEGRWYPDNVSLSLLLALHKQQGEIDNSEDIDWHSIQKKSGIKFSFRQLSIDVRQCWMRRPDNTLTESLVKVITGEYPTAPLDHARHRVWITGNEEVLLTRRFSVDEGEPDAELNLTNAEQLARHDLKLIKSCFRKYQDNAEKYNTRTNAAKLVKQVLPQLSAPGRCIAAWLSWKITEGRKVLVSTAQKYAVLLGEECFHLLAGIIEESEGSVADLINENIPALRERLDELCGGGVAEDRVQCIRRFLNDLHSLSDEKNSTKRPFRGAAFAAKFVNAGLMSRGQFCKILRIQPGGIGPLEWWSWLSTLRQQGLRCGELSLIKPADGEFYTDGLLETHIHGRVKTRSANRLVTTQDECVKLFYAMRKWLLSKDTRLLMPLGGYKGEKSIVSKVVNEVINQVLDDEDMVAHTLRHTYASEAFEDILDSYSFATFKLEERLSELSTKLGHSSIAVTFASYIHNSDSLIAKRLNAMTKPLTAEQMAALTHTRFISSAKSNQMKINDQRKQLMNAFLRLDTVIVHQHRQGRMALEIPPINDVSHLIAVFNALTLLPFYKEEKNWFEQKLRYVCERFPNLDKSSKVLGVSKPRSKADSTLFEHVFVNALMLLQRKPTAELDLFTLIKCYRVNASPNGFYCCTLKEARGVLKWLARLLPADTELNIKVVPCEHALIYHSEWQRALNGFALSPDGATKGELMIQVYSKVGNNSGSGMLPALTCIALHLLR